MMRRHGAGWAGHRRGVALVLLYQLWIFAHVLWWVVITRTTTAFMDGGLERAAGQEPGGRTAPPVGALRAHLGPSQARGDRRRRRQVHRPRRLRLGRHPEAAVEKNQKKGKVVAGGSTISQQLAKNLFLSGERSSRARPRRP